MNTIMMLKICRLFPDMYIMTAFIGIALAGAMAISHAFLTFKVSVSSDVDFLEADNCFFELCNYESKQPL